MEIESFSAVLNEHEKKLMFIEDTPLYKLPEKHKEIFKSDKPFFRHEIYYVLFGFAGRSFSRHIYPVLSKKDRERLFSKYIKKVRLDMLNGASPFEEMKDHYWLIDSVRKFGIKIPLLVSINTKGFCWIEEGHRRARAALISEFFCVPALVLFKCDKGHNSDKQFEKYRMLIS